LIGQDCFGPNHPFFFMRLLPLCLAMSIALSSTAKAFSMPRSQTLFAGKRCYSRSTALMANPIATCKTSMGTFKVKKNKKPHFLKKNRKSRPFCDTNLGAFCLSLQLELFTDTMPVTASNFIDLAKTGYYNGLSFHRVIPKYEHYLLPSF
jgi:hypothetical protein